MADDWALARYQNIVLGDAYNRSGSRQNVTDHGPSLVQLQAMTDWARLGWEKHRGTYREQDCLAVLQQREAELARMLD